VKKAIIGKVTAKIFFISLLAGALVCFHRVGQDVVDGKYFTDPERFRYELVSLTSFVLIILLMLRFGFYIFINKVDWAIVKDDFLYLLNRKYFNGFQWAINQILFWLALTGFIYALAVSTMEGTL